MYPTLNLSITRIPQKCSIEKGVLKNFAKFIGKHLCQSLFFNKIAGLSLRPATLLKKRLWHSMNTSDNNTLTFRKEKPKWTFAVAFIVAVVVIINIALPLPESIEEIRFSC